jgi:hypothetical protein
VKVPHLGVVFVASLVIGTSLIAQNAPEPRKGVVPIVGSTVGANGAFFATDFKLYGKSGLHGRLVFHPAGQIGDDATDPSLPYTCAPANFCLDGGDIVQAFTHGSGGIGSIDIIPDADSEQIVPTAFTRLRTVIRQAPVSITQYGTPVQQVDPDQWQRLQSEAGATRTLYIPAVGPTFRRSVGFRTLTDISFSIYTRTTSGAVSHPIQRTLPGNFTLLQPLDQFVGASVGPSDDVRITIDSGSAIAFCSYTHNVTNEPTLIIAQPSDRTGFVSAPQD